MSDCETPLVAGVNCTLIARRPWGELVPGPAQNCSVADNQQRLERRLRRDFSDRGSADTALRQLAELPRRAGYDPEVFASERVQAAIVLLARGDVLRLRQAIELAIRDWRDVLMAAGLADGDWPAQLDRELGAAD